MDIVKISSRKIYEEIAEQIKEQIVNGNLEPGQKLPSTRELTERFQVGRSTMREALSMLKAMGLIEIRQGEGCFVRRMDDRSTLVPQFEHLFTSREAIQELLEARIALEVANAGLAARKRTDADIAALEEVLAVMGGELGTSAVGEKHDMQFHRVLAQATHNPILIQLMDQIADQVELTIRETRRIRRSKNDAISEQLWAEHRAIVDAIDAHDEEGAQRAMRLHLQHVEQDVTQYVQQKRS